MKIKIYIVDIKWYDENCNPLSDRQVKRRGLPSEDEFMLDVDGDIDLEEDTDEILSMVDDELMEKYGLPTEAFDVADCRIVEP